MNRMSPSAKTLVIFGLAAFLSASIYLANTERRAESDNFLLPGYNPAKADQVWAAENMRLSKYADRQWLLFCFSFPLAMTFALLISRGAGWLPRFPFPRVIGAMIPIYVSPGLLLVLCALSRGLLLIPAVALAAYLLRLSIAILTSHLPRRFVLSLVLVNVLCSLLYVAAANIARDRSAEPLAIGLFIIANKVVAAVLYAKALLPPLAAKS
jgi:hypothetical protein